MLCRPVRLGIYSSGRRACASAGPSAQVSRRAGAEADQAVGWGGNIGDEPSTGKAA